ncbi:hypothetical protein ABT369_16900 [Dactylosporangium sp. NPDC000244]|uniref:hypothetical protein n=1 Tax=Dactylosporangium sp. NPDC000244 TaxID=3154365 RepID=UPI003334563E
MAVYDRNRSWLPHMPLVLRGGRPVFVTEGDRLGEADASCLADVRAADLGFRGLAVRCRRNDAMIDSVRTICVLAMTAHHGAQLFAVQMTT